MQCIAIKMQFWKSGQSLISAREVLFSFLEYISVQDKLVALNILLYKTAIDAAFSSHRLLLSHFTHVDPRGYFQPHVLTFYDSFHLDSLKWFSWAAANSARWNQIQLWLGLAKSNLKVQVCEELLHDACLAGQIFRAALCHLSLGVRIKGKLSEPFENEPRLILVPCQ